MSRASLIWVVLTIVSWQAWGDEPRKKYQVVSPKETGIEATGINEHGDVIGFEWIESKKYPGVVEQVPFFARGKSMTYLTPLAGYTAAFPSAVSADGVVVGHVGKPARPGRVPLRNQAFVWEAKSGMRGLGLLPDDFLSYARGISADSRRICGYSVGDNRIRACVWDRDGTGWKGTALPKVDHLSSNVVAMSDNGKLIASLGGERPCLWSQADSGEWSFESIGDPGSFAPRAVNNSGIVVGVRNTLDGRRHAVIWSRARGIMQLEKPEGYVNAEANDVNNEGVVVGMVDGPQGSKIGPNAFVYEGGRLRLLDEGGPLFGSANAINDRGQVTGVLDDEEEEPRPGQPAQAKEKKGG